MAEVVITEFMDEAAVADLAADFDVLYDTTLADRSEDLVRLVADCRGLIVRNRTQVRGKLLESSEQLKVVGRLGVGLDNIDVEACRDRGIQVFPATGANDLAVAEYVIAGVLMLLRGAYGASQAVAAGDWPRGELIGRETSGRQLGLIGFGGIARETVKRAVALGMTVVAHDPHIAADDPAWGELGVKRVDLDDLLASSDAVSLHVPLNASTRHLVDGVGIARMRKDAVLINASRGGVLDELALVDALSHERLGGAMLDVFEAEPLPPENIFSGVPNLILTPHIAGVTEESNIRVSALIAAKVRGVLQVD
ncbi:MAG: hydroxyacid dehydrogenase [Pseudomonadota bacterium]